MVANVSGRFLASIHLDEINSSGHKNSVMDVHKVRPMALSIVDKGVWYGFVITKCDEDFISPGESLDIELAFINSDEAESVFNQKTSILFGDGVVTNGVIMLTGVRGRDQI